MRLLLRAIALLAVLPGLGCTLFEAPPETYALPPPQVPPAEFRAPENDLGMVDVHEQSALWLAKCPIGSFYLFGSTELTRNQDYASFGPAVESAYAASQEVVNEIDLVSIEPAQTIALMKRYGTLKPPASLQSEVSHETWTLLEERFAQSGRSTATVQSLRPWLLSFALANHAALARGRDPLPGIADRVQERARTAGGDASKPVVGLGTLESQFQMFAALPRGVQDSLLRSALGGDDADELLWMSPTFLPQLASTSPERALLYEHLVYRRNESMADRLFELGIDGKVRFVAVGILHLVGERGIPALLAQRGYRVRRVQ
jgi:hypothetical protein